MSGLAAGTLLDGRYRVGACLGAGGMGTVYRADDLAEGRAVAVKVLGGALATAEPTEATGGRAGDAAADEHRHRFQREFRILTRLAHPYVVAVYDYGQHEGTPYYVMELLGGADLGAYARRRGGQLPEDEIRAVAARLCQGLAYIHGEGLIHRDLKPGNVRLIGPAGELPGTLDAEGWTIKVMDFGLARPHDASAPLTASGALLGTVSYMAPEQAQGRPLDPRADLYSLGVILYELAAGRLPFTGDSPVAVLLAHIATLPVAPTAFRPGLSAGLEEVIVRLLAKRPADRPATAADVLGALQAAGDATTIVARPGAAAPPRADLVFRAHLVGRDAELARLEAVLDRAWQAGDGDGGGQAEGGLPSVAGPPLPGGGPRAGLALVEGEAGVGKTRLVRELADHARLRGGKVLAGSCYEGERLPYGPFVEALRFLTAAGDESRALLLGLETDLAPLLPALPSVAPVASVAAAAPPAADPDQARLRLFDAAARLLGRLAARQPVLVQLDDLHWADDASLELLGYLVRNVQEWPILVCATARREERGDDHPLTRLAWALGRQRLVERLDLAPLSPGATAGLLAALLGLSAPPEALAAAVNRYAEGNPFFVEELVKMLAQEGRLERDGGRWRLAGDAAAGGLDELTAPGTIRDLVERRLAALPPAERDALGRAAVLGREFAFEPLLALDGAGEEALLDALTGLLRARLIEEVPDPREDRYRFVHGVVQEVVYAGLSRRRRRLLHLAAARALERPALAAGRVEPVAGQLARHFLEGGEPARAAGYGLMAGDRARRLYANQEAIRAYRLALAALDALPESDRPAPAAERLALNEGLGDVYLLIGEYEQAGAHFREWLELLQAGQPRAEQVAAAYQKLAAACRYRGQYAEAALSLEWGLGALGAGDEFPARRAALLLDLGWIAVRQGRRDEAADLGRRALALAEAAGDDAARAGAYDCLGMVYRYQGDYPAAIDYYRRGLGIKETLGDKGGIARTLNNLGILYEEQDDPAAALECYRRALALLEEIGLRLGQAMIYNNLGSVYFHRHEHAAAVASYNRTLELSEQMGHLSGMVMAHNNLGEVYQAMGEPDRALDHLRQAETLARDLGEQEGLLSAYGMLAEVYLSRQEPAVARDYAARALELAQAAGMRLAEEEARERLGRILILQGEADAAREHLSAALELSLSAGHRDLSDRIKAALDKLHGNVIP